MGKLRRKHRRRYVLYLRHYRAPKRRALLSPLQRAARLYRGAARLQGHLLSRRRDAGSTDVPCQLLVASLLHTYGRRDYGDAGRQDGRRLDLRTARHLQGELHRRGADGVADAATGPGKDRTQVAPPETRGDWWLRLPARHNQNLPGEIRRRGGARLGHDRDEPARLAVHHEAGICLTRRRREAPHTAVASPIPLQSRYENRRRRRPRSAM